MGIRVLLRETPAWSTTLLDHDQRFIATLGKLGKISTRRLSGYEPGVPILKFLFVSFLEFRIYYATLEHSPRYTYVSLLKEKEKFCRRGVGPGVPMSSSPRAGEIFGGV